jgi:hypothetical protein
VNRPTQSNMLHMLLLLYWLLLISHPHPQGHALPMLTSRRIVAVGDLHGDYKQTLRVLRRRLDC